MTLLENIESKNLIVPIAELKQDRNLLKEIQIQLERLGFSEHLLFTIPITYTMLANRWCG